MSYESVLVELPQNIEKILPVAFHAAGIKPYNPIPEAVEPTGNGWRWTVVSSLAVQVK